MHSFGMIKSVVFCSLLILISSHVDAAPQRKTGDPKEFPFIGRMILSFNTQKIQSMNTSMSKEVHTAFAQAKNKGYDFFVSDCTVTLIASNMALTAAHCVSDWPRNKSFNGMLTNGVSALIEFSNFDDPVAIDRVIFNPKFNVHDSSTYRFDWAILYFKHPVTGIPSAPMVRAESYRFVDIFRNETFVAVAYDGEIFGSGLLQRNLVRDDCKNSKGMGPALVRLRADYKIFVNDCKTVSGNSGGPLFVKIDNQYHLVGVLSSGIEAQSLSLFPMVSWVDVQNLIESVPPRQ